MSRISIIEVKALTKVFDNEIRAVDGISFTVNEGEILGSLGPNGAGKTTTLNMLATLLRPMHACMEENHALFRRFWRNFGKE